SADVPHRSYAIWWSQRLWPRKRGHSLRNGGDDGKKTARTARLIFSHIMRNDAGHSASQSFLATHVYELEQFLSPTALHQSCSCYNHSFSYLSLQHSLL